MTTTINIVAETSEDTVVFDYVPVKKTNKDFQSEADLEKRLIEILQSQGYEYLKIKTEDDLVQNLKSQIEKLNKITFTQSEWERFFESVIKTSGEKEAIIEKTRKIQTDDYRQSFQMDNGEWVNISLIDKTRIHNNFLQVINQYVEENGKHKSRYDVTILVNGLPLVHIELKKRGVRIKEAFNQINRYQRESFWGGSGLFEYVQIFVISNGTETKYYSNTTRNAAIKEANGTNGASKKTSNSFEFTSFWADGKNKIISDIEDFSRTFLCKTTILNIITRYCVFDTNEMLLVMRPYQIFATEKILNKIKISTQYKQTGTVEAGGYIWHTTGSGKTLTSFKTACLATQYTDLEKVFFVVDRKDLDYQTQKEYDRFEKGCASGNKSTAILQRQIEDKDEKGSFKEHKIIVTTIQKLSVFIAKNKKHPIYNRHVALVFDECHRSQFGEMHKQIVKAFKNYHLFGFTGTPIFASSGAIQTTEQAFGKCLHQYTIVDAIKDHNVLPFRVDYIQTVREKDGIDENAQSQRIDTKEVMESDERISLVVKYVLEHFNQKTKRNTGEKYLIKTDEGTRHVSGFNSIFAVSSIPVCRKYYEEFKKQQTELASIDKNYTPLKIATIFSYAPNEDTSDYDNFDADETFDTESLDASSRDFLERAIGDYNKIFKTNFSCDSGKFENYYKDVSQRVKHREVDLLLVVNMFLTGFDATTLNTLWVDKNLREHGLIQAFSRTNRILNSIKTYGNIVCFRNLKEETDTALARFGDKEDTSIVILRAFEDYYFGYEKDGKHITGYVDLIHELLIKFPVQSEIIGEKAQKEFIALYNSVLKIKNILSAFDDFAGKEMLPPLDWQDYQSKYLDIRDNMIKESVTKDSILEDVVFELELIRQDEINIAYILDLVKRYRDEHQSKKEVEIEIKKAINSSPEFRKKKDLIEEFIALQTVDTSDIKTEWEKFVNLQKQKQLDEIIKSENLKADLTKEFMEDSFANGYVRVVGDSIDKLLPAVSFFSGLGTGGSGGTENRIEKKNRVIELLETYFEKFNNV